MSSTGLRDQIYGPTKDDDSEISSTTPDNSGERPSVSAPTETDCEAISVGAESTFEPVIEAPEAATVGDALNVASTTAECIKDVSEPLRDAAVEPALDDADSIMDAEEGSLTSEVTDNRDNISEDILEPNKSSANEINKMILAEDDVDSSSLEEDIVLRWEDDDCDGIDETTPTDDVLKQLDLTIRNIDSTDITEDDKFESIDNLKPVTDKSELDNIVSAMQLDLNKNTGDMVQDVKSPDCKNDKHDVKMPLNDGSNKYEIDNEGKLLTSEDNIKILVSDDVEMANSDLLNKTVDLEKVPVSEKVVVDSTSIEVTKEVGQTMGMVDTENIEKVVKDSSMKEIVEVEKTINTSVAMKLEVSGPVETLTRIISDQDIFMGKNDIAAIETPCETTVQVDTEKKPESLPKDVEMDVDTEVINEKSVIDENPIAKDQNNKVIVDIGQDISEISKDVEYPSNKNYGNEIETSKNNMDVVVTSDSQDRNTPLDNLTVSLPIEVSQISNIVDIKEKHDPMSEILKLSEKDHAGAERDFVSEVDKEIKGDENISQILDDSILDTTITPNIHHRINKPNVMLDIPVQELSDIEAELDDDDDLGIYDEGISQKTKEIVCMEVDLAQVGKMDKNIKEYQTSTFGNITSKLETMDLDTTVETVPQQVSISLKTLDLLSTITLQASVDSSTILQEQENDMKLLTSNLEEKNCDEKSPSTDLTHKTIVKPSPIEIDDEKPTSMVTDEIDNENLSRSVSTQEIGEDNPSKLTKEIEDMPTSKQGIDDGKPISTLDIDTAKPSTTAQDIDDDSPKKQELHDCKHSTSNTTEQIDDQISSTSKLDHKLDDQKSKGVDEIHSTSKLTDEIDDQKLSPTKSLQEITDQNQSIPESVQENDKKNSKSEIHGQNPTIAISTQEVDDQPSTSKSTKVDLKPSTSNLTDEIDDQIPSASNSIQNDDQASTSKSAQEIDDQKPSSSKSIQVIDDQKPSTSKPDTLIADNEDIEEVTDSLGLLAESSRVVEDDNDEDDDDPEVDDNDEDDDFDPYEETNSEIAEDIDDSNTPPPDLDPKEKPESSPKVEEERESDEGTMDIVEGSIDIADDIDCDVNDLSEMETPLAENIEKDEPEIIDVDSHKKKKICPPEKIINILEKVLGPHALTGVPKEAKGGTVRCYVDLEASSDSDDVEVVSKPEASNVVSVNIPMAVEVMLTSGTCSTSDIVSKEGEVIISGVPKPPPHKMSKINTSEVTIKTTGISAPPIHIPETITAIPKTDEEIFNLDSDDEDTEKKAPSPKMDVQEDPIFLVKEEPLNLLEKKCINPDCSTESRTYYIADRVTAAYYSLTRRSAVVCELCKLRASERSEALINGIKDLRPLLELDMDAPSQQLVEISDSDSDGEAGDDTSRIGETDAMYLEDNLADMINDTWEKYKMESRLKETESYLLDELEKIEADAKEINAILDECQKKTDAVRLDFYKDYEPRRKSVGGIIIHDTPFSSYSHTEKDVEETPPEVSGSRYPKRRAASAVSDTPAKRSAIPMGYTPLDGDKLIQSEGDQIKADDDKEVSVVKLSAESAPADLPPCGEIIRPPLKTGMIIYAMRNAFGTWLKGRIMEVQPKTVGQQFTQCRVKFEHKIKNACKVLAARCLAYPEPSTVRMTIGTRVVALFKDPHNTTRRESFYSGVIAEIPNPVNSYRYLVFFDDGYAQYVRHQDTRIVCECSNLVWEEVHPFISDFICNYLLSYPERPMVRLHAGEKLKTEWNGKWWESKVLKVDASIALIHFDEDNRTEWIYRGSTRLAPLYLELQAAEKAGEGKTRSRAPRSKAQTRSNMPCVEYTRSDEQAAAKAAAETQALQQHNEEMRRQRAVAKKSTTTTTVNNQQQNIVITPLEGVISRVVYYTPKNAVKPYKMTTHICTIKCRRSDLLTLKDLRTYNPLAKPLLSGWEKQTIRHKGQKDVAYRAPCGRRIRNMAELHKYLRIIQSDMSVDLFDFTPGTHCLAEFVLNKCIVSKKDLSHGKENVPIPCVNYFDDSLPEFCSYNTERTPTAGVPLNLDPEFLCGCDCTDDCVDKTKCACWKMTLEGARTIGLDGPNVGYVYRRLPEPLPSGIYECNSRCKCKQTCLNRVAQHPLQLKLQIFKTINRGWGIRALNDVPKGSFICVYAGNLLTDATANLDGLNEGDEYLAELDYIEVVEGRKEGYEDDVADADKILDKKGDSNSESDTSESEEETDTSNKDDDFQPGFIPHSNVQFKKSLRKREKAKKKEEEEQVQVAKKNDCITISDDEEVREPSRFTAQAGMVDRDLISKQSSRVSVRTLFGKDEACYIMDAKVQGNIGRYLNHSCNPNVFVQNVFVDTHDPRFPWVAFFALSHVRAGAELTWNYNYDIGSVPAKVLYCYCGAPNCRGRLL